jgi:superfamily II DNA or RNA helicase
MLRQLNIKAVYNSEEDNILEDLYIPALSNSVSYDRSVGYWDAKMLTSAASGLACFLNNEGYMRLICGSTLTEGEFAAIQKGYGERALLERLSDQIREIVEVDDLLTQHQLQTLTWLIKNKKLDVKIALRRNGIHHQKIGIFTDSDGDSLIFSGSANETKMALLPFNYESMNVFKSWVPDLKEHFEPHIASFQELWENKVRNTAVVDITNITLETLSTRYPDVERPNIDKEKELWEKYAYIPKDMHLFSNPAVPTYIGENEFSLRPHQLRALKNWQEHNFRGVFELATGAGKTITAIYGAVKMYESRKRLFLVVAVPYQNLADQWQENLLLFNIRPIVCYGGEVNWKTQLERGVLDFKAGLIDFFAVIVVDATMTSNKHTFQDIVSELGEVVSPFFMFVGDECHHHGAYSTYLSLPDNAEIRMGLSATPDRQGDEIGNTHIENYYGPVVAEYTLKNALDDRVLTPYDYFVIPVDLSMEEAEKYVELSKKIAKLYAIQGSSADENIEDSLNALLLRRSKLVNGSVNKLPALEALLSAMEPVPHSLFYCSEGRLDSEEAGEDISRQLQINLVSNILHSLGWKSSQFTAYENKSRRKIIMDDFKRGHIDALVAMKCLDEGVDIPLCSTAFILSSSRKRRQFVQRRGRILRKSPGKNKAVIYDFMSALPLDGISEPALGKKLMIAELERIKEFASLSIDPSQAVSGIQDYLKRHDLLHHIYS